MTRSPIELFWTAKKPYLNRGGMDMFFRSARTSVSRPVHAKNPDHFYSLINHCRTTVNLSKEKKGKGDKEKRRSGEKKKKS